MDGQRDLAILLSEFDEEAAIEAVSQRLAAGEDPMDLVAECRRGMQIVGERYEEGVYYISALIMAGEVLRELLEILGPRMTGDVEARVHGTILMCTVQGDIHDVGKDIAATLLQANGIEVIDLGVDVPAERIAEEVAAQRPDVVGLSGLITQAFEGMRRTVDAIREHTTDRQLPVPVILGGSPMSQQVCDHAGADAWCTDAVEEIRLVRGLLSGETTPRGI